MLKYRAFVPAAVAAALAVLGPASTGIAQQAPAGDTPVLLYPGANTPVPQGQLLQPGAPYPGTADAPIKLIPPSEIKHHTTTPRDAAHELQAKTMVASPAKKSTPPKQAAKTATQIFTPTAPAPQPQAAPSAVSFIASPQSAVGAAPQPSPPPQTAVTHGIPLALTPTSPDIVVGTHNRGASQTLIGRAPAAATPPATRPQKNASLESAATPITPAPQPEKRVAPAKPPGQDHAGLTKRSQVLFAEGAVDPAPDTISDLRSLASSLTVTLKGTGRVQLEAFGGTPGDKSSDARRLSLKRALAVRALLIEDGVPAERIDVRALGGANDGGAPDRVDVFVHAS
jgi:outer membrane protein OmpA-like peptidoglycan-associated protein